MYTLIWLLVNYFPNDLFAKFFMYQPYYLLIEALMMMDCATASLNTLEYVSVYGNGSYSNFVWTTLLWVFLPIV